QWLSERLGQPFVVENRGGSGGNVGVAEVVRARPDGYTLLLLTVSHSINTSFYTHLTFDLLPDIAPIPPFYRSTYVMLVNPSLPVKTVPEFVAFARANAGKVNMGSNGIGATGHLAGEMFKMMTGVEMLHVPYRGEAPALTDLIGGQLHVQFASLAGSSELIKGGQLRALAGTSRARRAGPRHRPALEQFGP